MRAAVLALVPVVLAAPAAGARAPAGKVAFLERGSLVVVDVANGSRRVVARHVSGVPGLSGDGALVSVGGRVVGGPKLPTARLVWAPTGETAAFQTHTGAVFTWTPNGGRHLVVGASWGATSFAWGRNGELVIPLDVLLVDREHESRRLGAEAEGGPDVGDALDVLDLALRPAGPLAQGGEQPHAHGHGASATTSGQS